MLKVKYLFTILLIITLVLEGVNVYLSNKIAGTSIQVAKAREEVRILDERNTGFRTELLSYTSFEHVSSRAAELGFVEGKESTIMLKTPLQVALSR